MVHPNRFLSIAILMICTGCGGNIPNITSTPDFFTATLPPTSTPQMTQTPTLPAPAPVAGEESSISPIEGVTTTQVNVRSSPSTASASLGMVDMFAKVQVTGRDASGSWYQIVYAESESGKGWVRAEYVQVNTPGEIPLVEVESGSGSEVSGLVIQKVNVRSGPGTEYEALGVLNPNDLVFITGRDAGGKWIQIEFAGASDEKGWVTAELLQVDNPERAPLIGAATEETPPPTVEIRATVSAPPDGDSMQAPLVAVVFSITGSRALQVNGDVSVPDGDAEDWIQFTSRNETVAIQVTCPGSALRAELWNNGKPVDDFTCGEAFLTQVKAGGDYFLRLIQNEAGYTSYVLNLGVIR